MYMSDSEDDVPIKGNIQRQHEDEEDDESVLGFSSEDSDDEADDQNEEEQQNYSTSAYEQMEEDDEEFGNIHTIRAKKQEMGSDIEDGEEEYMPSALAWGKSTRNYLGADYVDNDGEGITEKNRMIAEAEEEEGLATQKRLVDHLDEDAIDFDEFPELRLLPSHDESNVQITNLENLSKEEKLQFLKKESPEFEVLVDDYRRFMGECEYLLHPFIKQVKKDKQLASIASSDELFQFICLKSQLLQRYCMNIAFYMTLKTKGRPIRTHPIRESLALFKKMCNELNAYQRSLGYESTDDMIAQVRKICGENKLQSKTIIPKQQKRKRELSQSNDKRPHLLDETSVSIDEMPSKSSKRKRVTIEEPSLKDRLDKKNQSLEKVKEQLVNIEKDEQYYSDEHQDEKQVLFVHKRDDVKKRKISRMIEKNKGLTPYRKKDHRHARIRYKSKFEKAEYKRKSQVKEAVKEINKYGGEYHGIKSSLVRSVRFK